MSDKETKNYYEAKGMFRQMIPLSEAHKTRLKNLAKCYSLNPGEVVEVMLDNMNIAALEGAFHQKQAAKMSNRSVSVRSELLKQMKGLSPEQLMEIQAIIAKSKSA